MTIQRFLKLDGPNIELEIIENGENRDRTVTWIADLEQIMDDPRDELVTWRITLPNMTPEQILCLGQQFIEAAMLATDERAMLSADQHHTIRIRREGTRLRVING